jgi:flagellar hook-basal body complex protein FliE
MVDPINANAINPVGPLSPAGVKAGDQASGDDFASALRSQLEKVSSMQREADEGVQKILTGQANNYAEVFSAAQKADVAFSLLMEIRNKMVEAYQDVRQIRV